MRVARLVLLVTIGALPVLAQSPFDGTWTLNRQKSNFEGQTMKIEDAGNGAIKFVNPNFSYTAKTDGTKVQTPSGGMMAIQKKGEGSYHETDWMKGKEISQSDWTLSDNGNKLMIHEYGTKPNGDKLDETTTYARVSGKNGLVGDWKVTDVKMSNPSTFAMKMGPGNQMVWDIPEMKATWKGKVDGKPYKPEGPTVPDNLTLTLTKQGPRTLHLTEKMQDKLVFTGTYSVSEDGKTMTVDGKNAKGEPMKEVWEKKG
jgi:hypothetical protein